MGRQARFFNQMAPFTTVFEGITPWEGKVPPGFLVDFTGAFTDSGFTDADDPRFLTMSRPQPEDNGDLLHTRLPTIEDGEAWFEAVDWVCAARAAKDRFVMMTLGAHYGAQAVGCYRVLQRLNPMPCKLVAVEPAPANIEWTERHFRSNGIDPAEHWLVPHAMSGDLAPVLFPIGAPLLCGRNAISTNELTARERYVEQFVEEGPACVEAALRNLLLHHTTGITRDLFQDGESKVEIKLVSAITLRELLAPFDRIDYLDADIQQSEIIVFPPFAELLRRKVKRLHIGTHGQDVHWSLHDMFMRDGWQVVFSFEPDARHETELGSFKTDDGILTVVNPDL